MFPEIIAPRAVRGAIDTFVDHLVTQYADTLESLSKPFLHVLVWLEQLLRSAPWWAVVLVVVVLAYAVGRRIGLAVGMGALLCVIGVLGLWDAGMQTLALMIMATGLSVLIGIPLGVLTARMNWLRGIMMPVLDVMQTMPSFVYLIPVVMLFGLGKIPAIIATVIYAVPPLIRLTDLGIRLVDREVLEAARAFGASPRQQLFGVQLPLALPNIMAGLNQTTMMALSMVVIASMIGARGLGYEVLLGINRLEVGRGLLAGLGIVVLAVLFDRITQSYGRRVRQGGHQ
ncbi:binding-protein-dependent transport protein [Bordetella ansorpii]|uniref:Binding-protein-dependent transport protein n=1 Tax=Bordetella ansorpii TaxID=288768 RepID=A0A157SPE4_9BORD|nr:proline/glycine betaine ABC transporter permease [Bordetella ansorpii]SAI72368.1 binding-protein-dependent transport protein [Bordetella ansorpii]